MAAKDVTRIMDGLGNETQAGLDLGSHDAVEGGRHAAPGLWILGTFMVPLLWLAIPHSERPWLRRTRWLVVAFVAASNLDIARHLAIENAGLAYMTGICLFWITLATTNLLIFTRPQLEAARAIRAPRAKPQHGEAGGRGRGATGPAQGASCRRRVPHGAGAREAGGDEADETWIWQAFPAKEGYLTRLGWVLDLACSIRGAGWNWAISPLPQPRAPARVKTGERVDVGSMARESGSGFGICATPGEFVRTRLRTIAVAYMVFDLASVYITEDPYFTFGPGSGGHELPAHLGSMPAWLLLAYREALLVTAIVASVAMDFSVGQLVTHWVWGYVNPGRSGPWQYASAFGSFSQVLDRGLAGWWGAWWHQILRLNITMPARYLTRRGHLEKGSGAARLATLATAFTLSGLIHAAGSSTVVAATKPSRSVLFFVLQAAGIVAQQGLARAAKTLVPTPSRAVARAANLAFATAFLYATAPLFLDDITSTGAWAREKLLVSPLRGLGLGHATDHWWRLDAVSSPRSCWGADC